MSLRKKVSVMKTLGVPYSEAEVGDADKLAEEHAKELAAELVEKGADGGADLYKKEIVALIAYLKSLGTRGGR